MQTVTHVFSAVGASGQLGVGKGNSILYRVVLSSDWDGTVVLRKTTNTGQSYSDVVTITTADSTGTVLVETEPYAIYKFFCTVFTAGTATISLNSLNDTGTARDVFGVAAIASGVTPVEKWDGIAIHKTQLQLSSVPVSVTSVTSGAGVGGTKIYTFPTGRILMLGCMADLSIQIATADQAAFTDATPEGDVGIGTLAPANADALGTDATDDNFATATTFVMSAYADASVQCPSEASLQIDGTSTAVPMFVNMLVDAVDIDDGTTSTVYASGIVTCYWINLGDF